MEGDIKSVYIFGLERTSTTFATRWITRTWDVETIEFCEGHVKHPDPITGVWSFDQALLCNHYAAFCIRHPFSWWASYINYGYKDLFPAFSKHPKRMRDYYLTSTKQLINQVTEMPNAFVIRHEDHLASHDYAVLIDDISLVLKKKPIATTRMLSRNQHKTREPKLGPDKSKPFDAQWYLDKKFMACLSKEALSLMAELDWKLLRKLGYTADLNQWYLARNKMDGTLR